MSIKIDPLEYVVQRVLPQVYDESLSYIELLGKVVAKLNEVIEETNKYFDSDITTHVDNILKEWDESGKLSDIINGALRFENIGQDSLEAKGSIYLKNDNNLFGRTPDGDYYNLITPQDNGILDIGDMKVPIVWIQTKGYHSLRAPLSPSYQKVLEDGTPVGPGRTIKHQENSSAHLVVFSVGEHVLEKDMYNELHTLTNVNGVFPPNSYNNFYYRIPRAGMYHFNPILKLSEPPSQAGYLRFAVRIMRANGQITESVMEDVYYDPNAYGTPFIGCSFMYRLSEGDEVQVIVQPLTENLTIGAGTKLYIYQHGDTIQQ